jgi:hypothetical protein
MKIIALPKIVGYICRVLTAAEEMNEKLKVLKGII